MSTTALKERVTGAVSEGKTPVDKVAHMLASPNMQAQIRAALPRHMTPERLARIVTTEIRKVPKLAECTPISFFGAVIQCAQLGLEPGNSLGHAYLLPYGKDVQLIIGYRGMIDLARRSGQIISIDARAVYEGDKFSCRLGLDPHIEHEPDWSNVNRTNGDKLQFVYAVAKLKDGGIQFDVMSRAEVEGIRARSKAGNNGPWRTDYQAMALKTVVRRLFKFLPVSIEIQTAVGLDERAEAGLSQDNGAVIDGQFTQVDDDGVIFGETQNASGAAAFQQAELGSYALHYNRMKECSDPELLDIIMDDARDLAPDELAEISEFYKTRRAQLVSA
jgi:recombination protein RecT